MSLLNDVLRDLDERRRERGGEGRSVLEGLQPTPEAPAGRQRTRGIFAVALAATIVTAVVSDRLRGDDAFEPIAVNEGPVAELPVAALPPVAAPAPTAPAAPEAVLPAAPRLGAVAAVGAAAMPRAPVAASAAGPTARVAERARKEERAARRRLARWNRGLEDIATPIEVPAKSRPVSPRTPDEVSTAAPPTAPVASETDPRDAAEARYNEGLAHAARGELAAAEADFREVLARAPGHGKAREALATLVARSGRVPAALALLEGGRRLSEDAADFSLLEARIRAEAGDAKGALAALEGSGSEGRSNGLEATILRAALLQRVDRHIEAAELYSALVLRDGSRPAWWMGLGISFEALGERPRALAAYQRARSVQSQGAEGQGGQRGELQGTARAWLNERIEDLGGQARDARAAQRGR